MSFNDLERGLSPPPSAPRPSPLASGGPSSPPHAPLDPAFTKLSERVSVQIFKINANVSAIDKLVDVLGTRADNGDIRSRLHDLTEATRALVKQTTGDVKGLASWNGGEDTNRQLRLAQQKLSRDFQTSLVAFQKTQRASAEKQRTFVDRAKAKVEAGDAEGAARATASTSPRSSAPAEVTGDLVELDATGPSSSQQEARQQLQQQAQAQAVSQSELEFQEALIAEREGEIREIEGGIHELNEIFRDLGTIVHEQQSMLDNIEYNVSSIANNTGAASEELVEAHEYQRKAGRRMACLMLIVAFVICVVLLAVLN